MRFIGSKALLLQNIENVIKENINSADSFCDIFSGTSIVGRLPGGTSQKFQFH
jgi:adenine-specific DNA-methyltransferase